MRWRRPRTGDILLGRDPTRSAATPGRDSVVHARDRGDRLVGVPQPALNPVCLRAQLGAHGMRLHHLARDPDSLSPPVLPRPRVRARRRDLRAARHSAVPALPARVRMALAESVSQIPAWTGRRRDARRCHARSGNGSCAHLRGRHRHRSGRDPAGMVGHGRLAVALQYPAQRVSGDVAAIRTGTSEWGQTGVRARLPPGEIGQDLDAEVGDPIDRRRGNHEVIR